MSEATITAKAKLIPRDFGETFVARITGDGDTSRFHLPMMNIDSDALVVYLEGPPVTVLSEGVAGSLNADEYSLDARTGIVTLWQDLAADEVLVAEGTGGLTTIPPDLTDFVSIAFDLHTQNRTPAVTIDDLDPVEEYLVAMLAVREALWAQISEAAQEVDVGTPEGMHIPNGQRYQQLMGLLDRIDGHYRDMAAQLNVGLYRIEMFNLRRVSRTTGRLVPLYVSRELEDNTPPVRVYPPIDTGGPLESP